MKNRLKAILQSILGYERYLRLFAWFKVRTLKWDRREREFFHFLTHVPRDGVVLDVGANLGFLCVHLARHVKHGRVIAFEPLPDNCGTLRRVLQAFSVRNVEVYPWALGDRDGEIEMVLPVREHAKQQGLGHVIDPVAPVENGIRFSVPLRRLDDLPQVNNPQTRVAAIKMDVENFERFVLRGARELLTRDHPLIYLELWDNDNRRECFNLAEELGYRVMVSEDGQLVPWTQAGGNHGNFFFVPPDHAAAIEAAERGARREVARSGGWNKPVVTAHSAECTGLRPAD